MESAERACGPLGILARTQALEDGQRRVQSLTRRLAVALLDVQLSTGLPEAAGPWWQSWLPRLDHGPLAVRFVAGTVSVVNLAQP